MPFGLFGKLPLKRDFVAVDIPHAVLNPFETWLQSAVAASRKELGADWERHYLVAPIWRFWIGGGIFGQVCAGALMPSVDRVGRYFPLALVYCDAPGADSAPPPFAPRDAWFAALEQRLLSALDEGAAIEVGGLVAALDDYAAETAARPAGGAAYRGGMVWRGGPDGADALMASLIAADYWNAAATRSFWWTRGGEAGRPAVHVRSGLPDPYFFSYMLHAVDG